MSSSKSSSASKPSGEKATPPAGSSATKPGKQQNPNQNQNYPTLGITLTPMNLIAPFPINFYGYLRLCIDVHESTTILLLPQMVPAYTLNYFLEYCLFALASHLFKIVAARPDTILAPQDAPVVSISLLPRPIYTYLSSLGDIKETFSGLHRVMDVSYEDVKAITHYAQTIGGNPGMLNDALLFPVTETDKWGVFTTAVSNEMDNFELTPDVRQRFYVYRTVNANLTDAECNALDNWIEGLMDHHPKPLTQQGVFNYPPVTGAALGAFPAAIHPLLDSVHQALVSMGTDAYEAFRPVVSFPDCARMEHRPAFYMALQSLSSKYACASGLPSVGEGSNSLFGVVIEQVNGWSLSAPRSMAPSYCAVSYCCAFQHRYDKHAFAEENGFTSVLLNEDPANVRRRWISSCIKA